MKEKIQKLFDDHSLGKIINLHSLSGGDVASAYKIESNARKYFVKVMPVSGGLEMACSEAAGLQELSNKSSFIVPEVVAYKTIDGETILVLEHLEKTPSSVKDWEAFGRSLALLHRNGREYFGWEHSNFIGRLPQYNSNTKTWAEFYHVQRLQPMIRLLEHQGVRSILPSDEKVIGRLQQLFPEEKPALIHGDLWSGNVMMTTKGFAIYDPSVSYGHREMDIGMSLLFGGFDENYLKTYNEIYPLEAGWEDRVELTQLYPLLAHAVMFGSGYYRQYESILKRFF